MDQDQQGLLKQVWSNLRAELFPQSPTDIDNIQLPSISRHGEARRHLGALMGDPSWADPATWQSVILFLSLLIQRIWPAESRTNAGTLEPSMQKEKVTRTIISINSKVVIEEMRQANPRFLSRIPNEVLARAEEILEENISRRVGKADLG